MKFTECALALAGFSATGMTLLLAHYAAPFAATDLQAYSIVVSLTLAGFGFGRWCAARYLLSSPRIAVAVALAMAWLLTLSLPLLYWAGAAKLSHDAILAAVGALAFTVGVPVGLARSRYVILAAIAGSCAPLWMLPELGLFRFCAILGLGHALISVALAWFQRWKWAAIATAAIAVGFVLGAEPLRRTMEWKLLAIAPNATVVHGESTKLQTIVLTEERGANAFFPGAPQHVLYLDGKVRFDSRDEQGRYTCLASVPLAAAANEGAPARSALVLGGGEGLVVRNLVAAPRLKKVTLVESDERLIQLAQNETRIRMYNHDSLRSSKVNVVIADPLRWVRRHTGKYDLIVVDLPLRRARLVSAEFLADLIRLLTPVGVLAIPAGHDDTTVASLRQTFQALGRTAHAYSNARDGENFLLVPPRGEFDAVAFFKRQGSCLFDTRLAAN